MLGGYGTRGSRTLPAIVRQRLTAVPYSRRSISSFRPQNSKFPARYERLSQTLTGGVSWRATAPSVLGSASARFNSSTSAATDSAAAGSGDALANASSDLPDLSVADINSIPERIGYLKDMGLDYGWGPSAAIEYVIEHFHMWVGLPWWASIVATGLAIRLALLYPMLGASDTAARIQNVKHISAPLRTEMARHASDGNNAEMARTRAELQKLHTEHGISAWKSFVPFLQIPFGYGCYRVVKGMAALPIPGLATEHALWLKDLTVHDPYFILPAATAFFLHRSLKKGGESGMNQFQDTPFGKMFFYGLPALSFVFMNFFPSALQLYFATTGLFALGQSHLLSSHSFRRMAGIAIPNPNAGGSGGQGQSEQSRAIRRLQEAVSAEMTKMQNSPETQKLSFIDRAINSIKQTGGEISREAKEKMSDMSGSGPKKNADGSPAAPPRLSEKDLKLAEDYERRRKEEEDWKRKERNQNRRQAHLQGSGSGKKSATSKKDKHTV